MTRRKLHFGLVALLAVLLVAGCKLVKNEPEGSADAGAGGSAQQQRSKLDTLAAEMWQPKILPHLDAQAVDLAELKPALTEGLAVAGEKYGYRPGGDGTPWSFATRFSGRITAANTDTRAATADVDIDDDGVADAVVQLGPVIRGTALRDVLPFLSFTDFADQIEYASLSRSLNARAYEQALVALPREDLVGKTISVLGVFTLRGQQDKILVTPVALKEGPTP